MVIVKVCFHGVKLVTLQMSPHEPLRTAGAVNTSLQSHGNPGATTQNVPGPAASVVTAHPQRGDADGHPHLGTIATEHLQTHLLASRSCIRRALRCKPCRERGSSPSSAQAAAGPGNTHCSLLGSRCETRHFFKGGAHHGWNGPEPRAVTKHAQFPVRGLQRGWCSGSSRSTRPDGPPVSANGGQLTVCSSCVAAQQFHLGALCLGPLGPPTGCGTGVSTHKNSEQGTSPPTDNDRNSTTVYFPKETMGVFSD